MPTAATSSSRTGEQVTELPAIPLRRCNTDIRTAQQDDGKPNWITELATSHGMAHKSRCVRRANGHSTIVRKPTALRTISEDQLIIRKSSRYEDKLLMIGDTHVGGLVMTPGGVFECIRHEVILRTLVDVEQIQLHVDNDDTSANSSSNGVKIRRPHSVTVSVIEHQM
jgi:hypothetical protein